MKNKIIILFAFLVLLSITAAFAESSSTVIVSIKDQTTYIYQNNILTKKIICSTGLLDNDNNTPLGDYIINESRTKRGTWFFSKGFNEGAKYWVGFIGGVYLFHSIPMDKNGNIIKSESTKLGTPSSHGCVRLSVDDAYWFYKNIPDGAALHIVNNFYAKQNLLDCTDYKNQPIPASDTFVFLSANGKTFKQKYTLSCEIALIRIASALCGITISEDDILSTIPREGTDPEKYFVCDDINAGRKNKDGSIHWNNYGAHPPVLVKEINKILSDNNKNSDFLIQEEKHDDTSLMSIIDSNKNFKGAIIWLVGHPERWGTNPEVNERGMVLGEHVCFVLPVKSNDGNFLIYNPDTGKVTSSSSTGSARNLFNYRTVCIYKK